MLSFGPLLARSLQVDRLWRPLLFERLRAGDVDGFRAVYNAMLQDCVDLGVITPDDAVVFRDTFPVFDRCGAAILFRMRVGVRL